MIDGELFIMEAPELVSSLKAVFLDLDAVCLAVNRNEIYKDVSREEIARYYNS